MIKERMNCKLSSKTRKLLTLAFLTSFVIGSVTSALAQTLPSRLFPQVGRQELLVDINSEDAEIHNFNVYVPGNVVNNNQSIGQQTVSCAYEPRVTPAQTNLDGAWGSGFRLSGEAGFPRTTQLIRYDFKRGLALDPNDTNPNDNALYWTPGRDTMGVFPLSVTTSGAGQFKIAVSCCQNLSQTATINSFDPTLDVIEITNWIAGAREVELTLTSQNGRDAQTATVTVNSYGQLHLIASSSFTIEENDIYTLQAILKDGFSGDVDVRLVTRDSSSLKIQQTANILRGCLNK